VRFALGAARARCWLLWSCCPPAPQGPLCRVALQPLLSPFILVTWVTLSQVQNPALVLVKFHAMGIFLPLLKYVITEALPPLLIALALASGRSILEPAGTGFIRHGGSFSQLLHRSHPYRPPLPKHCHTNP